MDSESFWHLIGGIGLFLLGMSLMTDGLMQSGTRALRAIVGKVTRSRWAGLATGAGVTAVIQSSSATTLITLSFVSAGLVTFQQSIAVMLGANIGTTSTAWFVSLVGLKVSSAALALPAIGIGAILRLISRGRRQHIGLAIAGFGFIFLGIDYIQAGMASVAETLRPEDIAIDGFLGTLALVGFGLVMTVVMQSSSAATATTLAAVNAGSINFEQAAALVIGQNIGTTVKAILGAMGGTLAAKRAAAAHIGFNLTTGVIAILALKPFTLFVQEIGQGLFSGTPEGYVALFHTAFNLVGVLLFMPILGPFSRLVTRVVPERSDLPTQRLTGMSLGSPALALEAARLTAMELGARAIRSAIEALAHASDARESPKNLIERAARLVREPRRLLTGEGAGQATQEARLAVVKQGLEALRAFLGKVGQFDPGSHDSREYLAVLYATDHIQRLTEATAMEARLQSLTLDPELQPYVDALNEAMATLAGSLSHRADAESHPPTTEEDSALASRVDSLRAQVARSRVTYRTGLLQRTVRGAMPPTDTDELLDTNRWLVDIGHGASRITELLVWPQSAAQRLTRSGEDDPPPTTVESPS